MSGLFKLLVLSSPHQFQLLQSLVPTEDSNVRLQSSAYQQQLMAGSLKQSVGHLGIALQMAIQFKSSIWSMCDSNLTGNLMKLDRLLSKVSSEGCKVRNQLLSCFEVTDLVGTKENKSHSLQKRIRIIERGNSQ